MTAHSPLYQALARIRHAELSPTDRELLRPAFAALDGAQVVAVPERVAARIRDIDARMPKRREA
jgi:hypothetical protein